MLLWLITTFGSSQTGLTVNVRNSSPRNKPSRAPPSTGTSQPVELPKEQAGPSRGFHLYSLVLTPVIGFRSLHRRVSQTFLGMMIRHHTTFWAASDAVFGSGNDDYVWPGRREGWLEWKPPPHPEPSRLDVCFLGVAHAGSQGPTPVPFFLEVA